MRPLLALVVAVLLSVVVIAPAAEGADVVRRDAKHLTARERADFVGAVLALKRMPAPYRGFGRQSYYDLFVTWHRDVFRCPNYTAHMSPSFLPWHRYYLRTFERALSAAAGKPIALPYWNWTDPASTRAVFRDDLMGPDGDPARGGAVTRGAFRKGSWRFSVVDPKVVDPVGLRYLTRNFGTLIVDSLPPRADVLAALRVSGYDVAPFDDEPSELLSFRNNLEGWREEVGEECSNGWVEPIHIQDHRTPHEMHNRVHLWTAGATPLPGRRDPVAGTMANNTSPNDPVFWLHHANIDRIWESWIRRHGPRYATGRGMRVGQRLNDSLSPFARFDPSATPAAQLRIGDLGYRYDRLVAGRGEGGDRAGAATAPVALEEALAPSTLRFSCALPRT
ncbi:MAG TPA: tyrosinase family protein [Conexibacter sp.]|nr:tyrosinase family protein [Conexibacter sp.]